MPIPSQLSSNTATQPATKLSINQACYSAEYIATISNQTSNDTSLFGHPPSYTSKSVSTHVCMLHSATSSFPTSYPAISYTSCYKACSLATYPQPNYAATKQASYTASYPCSFPSSNPANYTDVQVPQPAAHPATKPPSQQPNPPT